ncbi:hypothetical protein [Thermaerobacillus caldiproteolyticus]|uniref:hypothetical protein n=1 Tax=Thermaerobacillus caldiproteolyticus TaxID=247480 RepID=UPI0018F1B8CD|nr:hypothetical protein [Anoxybacillus caldiproteolyticus]
MNDNYQMLFKKFSQALRENEFSKILYSEGVVKKFQQNCAKTLLASYDYMKALSLERGEDYDFGS